MKRHVINFIKIDSKKHLKKFQKIAKERYTVLLEAFVPEGRKKVPKTTKQFTRIGALTLVGLAAVLMSFESFSANPMISMENANHAFAKETKGITVTAKQYTSNESVDYLDRNLIKLGYQPIQVTIQNHTGSIYELSKEGISLPSASPNRVALSVSAQTLPRSIALKVASLFFWPFMIPSTLEGIATMKTHYQIWKDYSAKAVKEGAEEIAPYAVFHRVIFVPKEEIRENITVTLVAKGDRDKATSFTSPVLTTAQRLPLEELK